jgi:hypothetical protein
VGLGAALGGALTGTLRPWLPYQHRKVGSMEDTLERKAEFKERHERYFRQKIN